MHGDHSWASATPPIRLADVCRIGGEANDCLHLCFKQWRSSLREGGAAELIAEVKQLEELPAA